MAGKFGYQNCQKTQYLNIYNHIFGLLVLKYVKSNNSQLFVPKTKKIHRIKVMISKILLVCCI